jgi:hypothetical protein
VHLLFVGTKAVEEELTNALDFSCCHVPDAKSFRVHRKSFIFDGSKVEFFMLFKITMDFKLFVWSSLI